MRKKCAIAAMLLVMANTAFADDVSRSGGIDLTNGRTVNAGVGEISVPVQQEQKKQVKADPFDEFNGKPLGKTVIVGAPESAKALIKSKAGDTVTEELVRGDLLSIYSDTLCQDVKPTFAMEDNKVTVTYHYVPMPAIRSVEVTGATVLNQDVIRQQFVTGKVIPRDEIDKKLQKLIGEYHEAGYAGAGIIGREITVDGVLRVAINEGVIAGYKVTGNKKTKPHVILREMRQKVGEPLNAKLLQRSLQRVFNLGFFEEVNTQINPTQDGRLEVEVIVEEANAATVSVGAGYSHSDGVIGTLTLQDKNFMGQGDNAMIRWEFGGKDHNKNYELSYTKPWIDKKGTAATFTIYDMTNEYADYDRNGHEIARYDKRRLGQELTFSRPASEYTRNYLTLRHRNDKYKKADDDGDLQYYEDSFDPYLTNPRSPYHKYEGKWPATAAERRKENFGESWSLQFMHVYDSRDSYLFPRAGKHINYSGEIGFAGDFHFTKWDAEWRYYFPVGKNVIGWDTEIGYATGRLPLSHRFAAGGTNYLRGYEDNQYRGNSLLRTTLEYRIPIAKKVTGVVFADYGYAWDKRYENAFDLSDMKFGYGVGLRAQTPMGMLRLDYGIGQYDKRFHFSFGGSF